MRFFFKWSRRRDMSKLSSNPHLRRDIGLPEIDRSDLLIGRINENLRGWV